MGKHDLCKNPFHQKRGMREVKRIDTYTYFGICVECGRPRILDIRR